MEETKLALDPISLYQIQYDHVDKLWDYFSVVVVSWWRIKSHNNANPTNHFIR